MMFRYAVQIKSGRASQYGLQKGVKYLLIHKVNNLLTIYQKSTSNLVRVALEDVEVVGGEVLPHTYVPWFDSSLVNPADDLDYIVWSPDGKHPPKVRHPNKKAAKLEATRLANLYHGGKFYVCAIDGFAHTEIHLPTYTEL